MNLHEYETQAARTIPNSFDITAGALGLCGESGEFADLWKKHVYQNHPLDRDKVISELGDIFWYLNATCKRLGLTLGEVADYNIKKLTKRYPNGFSGEDSRKRRLTKEQAGEVGTAIKGAVNARCTSFALDDDLDRSRLLDVINGVLDDLSRET